MLFEFELGQKLGVLDVEEHRKHRNVVRPDRQHLAVEVLPLDLNPLQEPAMTVATASSMSIDLVEVNGDAAVAQGSRDLVGVFLGKQLIDRHAVAGSKTSQSRQGKASLPPFVGAEHGSLELTVCCLWTS